LSDTLLRLKPSLAVLESSSVKEYFEYARSYLFQLPVTQSWVFLKHVS